MKNKILLISFGTILMMLSSCVHFVPLALDTSEDNDPYYVTTSKKNSDYSDKFTATDIFTDVIKNTWGLEKDNCREFVVVNDVKKAGSSSLHMKWNQSEKGCGWIGAGFAWNNWQIVDMSDIIDTWGLRFYIRSIEGTVNSIPIMINFLDESNKSSETITVNSMFYEGTEITEEWKEVIIPLSYFRIIENGLNPSEITQLILGFNGTAEFYFDEFQLIELEESQRNPQKSQVTTTQKSQKTSPSSGFTATDIYTDMLKNTWGAESDACREFNVVNDIKKSGAASLKVVWDKTKAECDWIGVGWNWNNWQPTDMSDILDTWALRFFVRTVEGTMDNIPIGMTFLDKGELSSETVFPVDIFYEGSGINEEWKEVIIPLSYFQIKELGLNASGIKQLVTFFDGNTGGLYIDELQFIQITEQNKESKSENNTGIPTKIYADKLSHEWGFEPEDCKTISVVTSPIKKGNSALHMKWDAEMCSSDIRIGFAWNNWHVVDMTQHIQTWALSCYIRTTGLSVTSLPLTIQFSDSYYKESEAVTVSAKYSTKKEITEEWTQIIIPLSDFKIFQNGLNPKEIIQIIINLDKDADIYLDELHLIEIQ
ncbi:MAG: hypothetical protein PF481_10520 [Bacteroidales bacterium]|jgi:hypothetical protein|nr:hypothetical protein [Bacteroidales bacterium]